MSNCNLLLRLSTWKGWKVGWSGLVGWPIAERISTTALSNLIGLAGHKVEHWRREDRAAEGTKGDGMWGEGVPLPYGDWSGEAFPTGRWVWGGGTLPRKNFQFLSSKWRVLVHSWCKNYYIRTVVCRQHVCIMCYYFLIKTNTCNSTDLLLTNVPAVLS